MQKDPEPNVTKVTLSIPPSFVTAEMFTPYGKRYNFEQGVLDTTTVITLVNQSGNKTVLRFWDNRQSEKNFPVDPAANKKYASDTQSSFQKPTFRDLYEYFSWWVNNR